MVRILMIAMFAVLLSSEAVVAQSQSNRRGRFFQKIRDDLFGGSKQTAPTPNDGSLQQQAQKLQLQYQQRLQQQQQRQPSSSRTPTPLRSTTPSSASTGRTPTPLTTSRPTAYPKTGYPNTRTPSNKAHAATIYSDKKSSSAYNYRKKPSGNRNGFGFRVSANDRDQLIVTAVERAGNAAEAGVVRGDQIIEIGGIESTSSEEFDEIAKIMGQGDQMDFKIRRGGREKKVTIQFGNLPELEESETSSSAASSSSKSSRYDFAPPRDSGRATSVGNSGSGSPSVKQVSTTSARQIQQLNQTIVNQHRQIQDLRKEVEQLKQGYRSR